MRHFLPADGRLSDLTRIPASKALVPVLPCLFHALLALLRANPDGVNRARLNSEDHAYAVGLMVHRTPKGVTSLSGL
jgi:hypothetical protein